MVRQLGERQLDWLAGSDGSAGRDDERLALGNNVLLFGDLRRAQSGRTDLLYDDGQALQRSRKPLRELQRAVRRRKLGYDLHRGAARRKRPLHPHMTAADVGR